MYSIFKKSVLSVSAIALMATASAAYADDIEYPSMLHVYWKLSPPSSYEPFLSDYAKEAGDIAPTEGKHELDERTQATISAEQVKKRVDETDLKDPMTIYAGASLGQYDKAAKGFRFVPFNPGYYFTFNPNRTYNQTLPLIKLRFTNGHLIQTLPMPESVAKTLLDTAGVWSVEHKREVEVQATFVPQLAKEANKEVRGRLSEVVVSYPVGENLKYTGEIARYSFGEDGKLTKAEYTGVAE